METLTPCSRLSSSSSSAVPSSFNGVFVPTNNTHPNTFSGWSLRSHRVTTTIRASAATPENRAFPHSTNAPSNPIVVPNRRLEESRAVANEVEIGLVDKTSDSIMPASSADTLPLLKVSPESLQYELGYLGAISDKTSDPHNDTNRNGGPTNVSYLTSILSSKFYEVAFESPLQYAPKISQRSGVRILLKHEDLQPVSIFITIELIISICFFYSSNVDLWVSLLLNFYKKNVDI